MEFVKSKDLRFDRIYVSLTEWEGLISIVIPFAPNGEYDITYAKKRLKKYKDIEFIYFKNDFAYFGRRAIAFMKHTNKMFQFETIGQYPYLVKEAMRYAIRGILIINSSKITEQQKKSLELIRIRPYLVRTYAENLTRGELLRIRTRLRELKVPFYYWDIVGDDTEFYKRRLYG